MLKPKFIGDLAPLHTHAFGHRALTWWGVIAFFMIEGTAFVLAIAAYFFLMNQEQLWPPPPHQPPDLLAGTLFTILLLLSEIPNSLAKKAGEKGQIRRLRPLMLSICLISLVLLGLRGWEFASLNVWWYENAYGSIIWTLLFLHLTHFLTDWIDTVVLTALMHGEHAHEGRRYVDVSENCLYWRFVWLSWLPIYVLIYWLPRWVH